MIKKADIISQVKAILSDRDTKLARDDSRINRAFSFAVGDLSDRMMETERLDVQTITIAANTREQEITGVDSDIDDIFYLLYGTGSDQTVLEYVDLSLFLKQHNDPSASAGTPTKFTWTGQTDDGYPNIKFDCPTSSSDSLEVWYFMEPSEDAVRYSKAPVLVNFTLAHFFGTGSADGLKYYTMGLNGIKAAKAKTKRIVNQEMKFQTSIEDRNIRTARINWRNKR